MENNHSNPRKPTEAEWDELVEHEFTELQKTRRVFGYSSVDEGDLAYMLDTASVVVFDTYNNNNPAPRSYTGKIMLVVWNIRSISTFVWKEGKLTQVREENKVEIR